MFCFVLYPVQVFMSISVLWNFFLLVPPLVLNRERNRVEIFCLKHCHTTFQLKMAVGELKKLEPSQSQARIVECRCTYLRSHVQPIGSLQVKTLIVFAAPLR